MTAHIILLGVGAVFCLLVARCEAIRIVSQRAGVGIGTCAGFGYCLDGALGPALLICSLAYCLLRGGWRVAVVCAVLAAPWVIAHHGVLYAVTGNPLSPASDPKNWDWPNSPFSQANLTGNEIKHNTTGAIDYAWQMTFGPRGFITHNLPLLLALAAVAFLLVRSRGDWVAIAVACGWVVIGATPYVLGSDNLSGVCLSIRWFVPFLAPGFWLIGLLLRRAPICAVDLAWLSAGGLALSYYMLKAGPWEPGAVKRLALIWTITLVGWGVVGVLARGKRVGPVTSEKPAASSA